MPTRRTLELIIVASLALKPVLGMVHLWSKKTLDEENPGSVKHGVAEILTVVV
jgi:hypothetical protein